MNKDWSKIVDPQPFKDIAIFSADYYGHSYWSFGTRGELKYILHFVDRDFLPEELCEVAPLEAIELKNLVKKFGHGKENYLAVWNWVKERGDL